MGAYKFWNPTTSQYEIIKSKSIINADGTNEYTPDEVKVIDDKIDILKGAGVAKEKVNKVDFESHKAEKATQNEYGHIRLQDIPNPTKSSIGLSNVDNVKQMPISGGTFTGISKAHLNTSYTVAQMRNIILSPSNASVDAMQDGEIWIKYK